MVIHGISLLSLARLLLLLIFSHEIAAQNASNYKPISYAASAILSDGSLYLYGGVIKFAVTNAGTSQFLRIDLTQNFDTTSPPWVTLPGYLTYTMVEATPSMNGEQLILGGNRDIDGPLSYIYDVAHAKWTITPTLPGMSTMTGYKRSNVGMALDRHTGLVYIYGGFNRDVFLRELSVLDTNNKGPSEMKWTLSFNQATIPTLYEPYVLYLPTQRKILVMAGCVRMDTQGYASACTPLNVGYLVSGGASRETLSLQTQQLSTGPAARYQGCRVVLANGDVFIQGGRDPTTFYGDAWLLNVGNWSWTSITINGPPAAMTRAGHTCQLGPNGQVIIIGGFRIDGTNYTYVTPYMAVIDTNTWTWTTQYKGAPLNSIWPRVTNDRGEDNKGNGTDNAGQSDGLSTGAKGGIGAGVALLVVGLALGLFFYRKKRLRRGNQKNGSNFPQQPLYEKDQRNQQHGNHNHYSHNNQSDVNHLMHGRGSEHPSPTGSGPEVVSQSGSGMPVMYHAAYTTDGYGGGAMPATVVRPDAYPLPPPSSSTALAAGAAFPLNVVPNVIPPPINGASRPPNNVNLVYAPPPLPNQGTLDDAALAAALYQAEDSLSSTRSLSPAYTSASLSHLNHPTMSQHQYPANVNASYIDSPLRSQDNHPPTSPMSLYSYPTSKSSGPVSSKVSSSSVALSSAHPSSQSQVSSTLSRVPTIHTPVISTILAPDADGNNSPRQPLGPQSVPEKEAWIERSSPGVRTQLVNARDLDADGLYKPLTPTRVHGSHSILVGAPASHVASNANSFAAASSSLKFSPAGHAGQMTGDGAENGKEGRAAHEGKAHGQSLVSNSGVRPMTGTSSTSYRDPQMMKDLDDIARMIETQALTETKSPHTIVSSPLSQSEGREGR